MAHIIHDVYLNRKPSQRLGSNLPDPSLCPHFFLFSSRLFQKLCHIRSVSAVRQTLLENSTFLCSVCLSWLGTCAKTVFLSPYICWSELSFPKRVRTKDLNDGESITYFLQIFEYSFEGKTSPCRLNRTGVLYAF